MLHKAKDLKMDTNIILEKYREYVEDLAKKKSSETFTNAGKEHASILMSILFRYTDNEARIFCEGFKPELIMTQPYWSALNDFLKKENNKLSIMVETNQYIHEKPFELLQENKERRNNATIEVRLINEEDKKYIFDQLNTEHCNFAIFDNNKFRLEYIPENYQAIGSFNQPQTCQKLTTMFDKAFRKATVLI